MRRQVDVGTLLLGLDDSGVLLRLSRSNSQWHGDCDLMDKKMPQVHRHVGQSGQRAQVKLLALWGFRGAVLEALNSPQALVLGPGSYGLGR